jgi:hypothetical protein
MTNLRYFEVLFVSWIDIHQARTRAIEEEIIAKMTTHRERIGGSVNAWQKKMMVR